MSITAKMNLFNPEHHLRRPVEVAAVMWMATLAAYGWYTRGPGPARYLLLLITFALGLMSKPMLVTLPFVLLLLDYC